MSELKYSFMWDAYNTNICKGLSLLQQHGEFVDMTLAADGHHVKVHKMVMSLVSPYIKDLISSADCPHPVIFLNQISYETLTAILEYVYTGQVTVAKDDLTKFMEACKALHIKGFEELDMYNYNQTTKCTEENNTNINETSFHSSFVDLDTYDNNDAAISEDNLCRENDDHTLKQRLIASNTSQVSGISSKKATIQYALSNQGNLHLVLNRYIYRVNYSAKKCGRITWRCVDVKCTASVTTHRDQVISRYKPHKHPHHDKRILNKIKTGTIFTNLHEAETKMHLIRKEREKAYEDENKKT